MVPLSPLSPKQKKKKEEDEEKGKHGSSITNNSKWISTRTNNLEAFKSDYSIIPISFESVFSQSVITVFAVG